MARLRSATENLSATGASGCRARSTCRYEWEDVSVRARFLVEPASEGVLACGFMVRVADTATYYYVHFDRAQAILVRIRPRCVVERTAPGEQPGETGRSMA